METTIDDATIQIMSTALSPINNNPNGSKNTNNSTSKNKWVLVIVTSLVLDIHLPSEFGFIIGDHKPISAKFRSCSPNGCVVVIPVDSQLINAMKKANEGNGIFTLVSGKLVKLNISLKGFTKAFNALTSHELPDD